jgi:hypothetical protein
MISKRQKRNRKILKIITIILLLIEFVLGIGIGGNCDLSIDTNLKIIVFYLINTLILAILIKICKYLGI